MIWVILYVFVGYLTYGLITYGNKGLPKYDRMPQGLCTIWPLVVAFYGIGIICLCIHDMYTYAKTKWFPKFNLSKLNLSKLNLGYVLSEMVDVWHTKRSERSEKLRIAIEAEEQKHRIRLSEIEEQIRAEAEQEVEECLTYKSM